MSAVCSASWRSDGLSAGDLAKDIAHHLRSEWLFDVQVDVQLAGFLAAQLRAIRRDDDAQQIPPAVALGHFAQQLHAVHHGHVEIGEYCLDAVRPETLQRLE